MMKKHFGGGELINLTPPHCLQFICLGTRYLIFPTFRKMEINP